MGIEVSTSVASRPVRISLSPARWNLNRWKRDRGREVVEDRGYRASDIDMLPLVLIQMDGWMNVYMYVEPW